MTHKSYGTTDVAYFGFGANNASGFGFAGSAGTWHVVDLNCATADNPIASGSADRLTGVGHFEGTWRVRVSLSATYSANTEYGVWIRVNVSGVTPTAFIGSFDVGRNKAQVERALSAQDVPSSTEVSALVGPAVWNEAGAEPTVPIAWGSVNRGQEVDWLTARATNRHNQSSTKLEIFSSAGTAFASASVSEATASANIDQWL